MEDSSGQASIFVIALVALTFVLTAFFVDVSRSLAAHGASLEVAAQAARAGADQVTQESLRAGDPQALRIDPPAAEAAGRAWLSEAGASGEVRVVDDGTAVTVTARVPCPATLLKAFGYEDLSRPATASATLLTGTAGGQGQPITPALARGLAAGTPSPAVPHLLPAVVHARGTPETPWSVAAGENGTTARAVPGVWAPESRR